VLTAAMLLEFAKSQSLAIKEARVLIACATKKSKEWLIAHEDDDLAPDLFTSAQNLINRRIAGEPVAYLLGEKEFYGNRFQVNPSVLIPRPETEMLVDQALTLMGDRPNCRVIDLGTGSGCIGISLALKKPHWDVLITDVSESALTVAALNALALGAENVSTAAGSWWGAVNNEAPGFDLIISNPPYIQKHDLHLTQGDLRFEPEGALTDFADGLSAYEAILEGIHLHPHRLNALGYVIFEHGFDQATALKKLITAQYGLAANSYKDLAEQPRMMVAQRIQSGKIK
jgi:release factor glutamine methyltransferase